MKFILKYIIIISIFALVSCVSETDKNIINLNVTSSNDINVDDYIVIDDSLVLHVDDKLISYKVQDVCMGDSSVFVLDVQKNIISFDKKSGIMKHAINKVGHGKGEYISPQSICFSNGCLYVLDMQRSIVQYDENLTFVRRIKLDCSGWDFLKIRNGFAIYTISSVILIDENGKNQKSFSLDVEKIPQLFASVKSFSRTDTGVYFVDFVSNVFYELKDNNLNPILKIEVGDEHSKESELERKIYSCFPYEGKYFTYYFSNRYLQGSIYDTTNKKSISGLFKSSSYPIMPYFENKGFLYGIFPKINAYNKYVLIKYKVSQNHIK